MRDAANSIALRAAYGQLSSDGVQLDWCARNTGCIPGSRMAASVNPTAADIACTIGGKQFKVVAALGVADATVQVLRAGSAALTYANLVDAINGKVSVQNTSWREATTPFAAAVVADLVTATQLRLRQAVARGGLASAGVSTSFALLAAVTGGATAWSTTNLNTNGKSPQDNLQAFGSHVVTAAEVTAAFIDFELAFQPTQLDIYATSSVGALKSITELVTIPASQLSLHLTVGTGATALVAGDIVYWWAAQ